MADLVALALPAWSALEELAAALKTLTPFAVVGRTARRVRADEATARAAFETASQAYAIAQRAAAEREAEQTGALAGTQEAAEEGRTGLADGAEP